LIFFVSASPPKGLGRVNIKKMTMFSA